MEVVKKRVLDNPKRLVKTYNSNCTTDLLYFRHRLCSGPLFFVILFLVIPSQNNVCGSVSNSTSRLKHERNGRCK